MSIQIVDTTGSIDPNTPVSAGCPQGATLTAGGWQITKVSLTKDVVAILSSYGSGSQGVLNAWNIKARIARGSSASPSRNQIIAYAVCAKQSLGPASVSGVQISAPPGPGDIVTPGLGHVSCNSGQLLTGAGFRVDDIDGNLAVSVFSSEFGTSPAQWAMTMESLPDATIEGQSVNGGGTGALVPICVKVS